jgi:uncharacterized protein
LRRGHRRDERPKLGGAVRAPDRDPGDGHPPPRSRGGVLALRRALGKSHPRVAGIDDGAFARRDRYAPLAAVVVSAPERVESVRVGRVRVDGRDGTARVVRLLAALGDAPGIRAVLIDGAVVGGFNVLDLDAIRRAAGVPVVAVTRRPPDFDRIRAALERWFPRTAAARFALLRKHRLHRVRTGGQPIWAAAAGCSPDDAAWLVRRTTVVGHWPEPLRLAHLVASAGRPVRRRSDRTVKRRRPRPGPGPVA